MWQLRLLVHLRLNVSTQRQTTSAAAPADLTNKMVSNDMALGNSISSTTRELTCRCTSIRLLDTETSSTWIMEFYSTPGHRDLKHLDHGSQQNLTLTSLLCRPAAASPAKPLSVSIEPAGCLLCGVRPSQKEKVYKCLSCNWHLFNEVNVELPCCTQRGRATCAAPQLAGLTADVWTFRHELPLLFLRLNWLVLCDHLAHPRDLLLSRLQTLLEHQDLGLQFLDAPPRIRVGDQARGGVGREGRRCLQWRAHNHRRRCLQRRWCIDDASGTGLPRRRQSDWRCLHRRQRRRWGGRFPRSWLRSHRLWWRGRWKWRGGWLLLDAGRRRKCPTCSCRLQLGRLLLDTGHHRRLPTCSRRWQRGTRRWQRGRHRRCPTCSRWWQRGLHRNCTTCTRHWQRGRHRRCPTRSRRR